jgi:hypothetical protein
MHDADKNIDDLFRNAAENYQLKDNESDWDKISAGVSAYVPPANGYGNINGKNLVWLLLLLTVLLVTVSSLTIFLFSNLEKLRGPEVIAQNMEPNKGETLNGNGEKNIKTNTSTITNKPANTSNTITENKTVVQQIEQVVNNKEDNAGSIKNKPGFPSAEKGIGDRKKTIFKEDHDNTNSNGTSENVTVGQNKTKKERLNINLEPTKIFSS